MLQRLAQISMLAGIHVQVVFQALTDAEEIGEQVMDALPAVLVKFWISTELFDGQHAGARKVDEQLHSRLRVLRCLAQLVDLSGCKGVARICQEPKRSHQEQYEQQNRHRTTHISILLEHV